IVLLCIAIAAIFIYVSSDIRPLRKGLFWSFLFNSNHYFAGLDTYFGTANTENPLLHTWTLGVEMQFYLFLPVLLFFIKKKWLPYVFLLLTVMLFVYSEIEISYLNNKSEMYFSTLARTPEFFIGSLFSLVASRGHTLRSNYSLFFSIISIVAIL